MAHAAVGAHGAAAVLRAAEIGLISTDRSVQAIELARVLTFWEDY